MDSMSFSSILTKVARKTGSAFAAGDGVAMMDQEMEV